MAVKPIGNANPSFTLERAASDCPPLQFVREFTMNSIEAIRDRRARDVAHAGPARIVWREFSELAGRVAAPKLACIDTGMGMTGDDLERYINSLASTSKTQSLHDSFGLGAKIAGAVGNPAGLTYLSWTGSPESGRTCTLALDRDTGEWGLSMDPQTGEIVQAADEALCPPEIRKTDWRGTVVVFHGTDPAQDTTQPPTEELGVDWLIKVINQRFFELPGDIDIRCQRPGERERRRARGQRVLLDQNTVASGAVRLSDATAHWRILADDHERLRKQNHRWAATGHRAALHEGELYELRGASAGGFRKLQEFGITFGYQRVVLYVEPDDPTPDQSRAHLTVSGDVETKDLPWDRWADEFVADMPKALRALVECSAGRMASRDRRDIMRKLEQIAADMPLPRYRSTPDGADGAGGFTHGGNGRAETASGGGGQTGDNPGGSHGGNVVSLFTRTGGPPATRVDSGRIPEIKPEWVRKSDGTRVPPVLEDRAAQFLPRTAVVQLSEDFRGYQALDSYFRGRYGHLAGVGPVIEAEIKRACEDLVIEFIVGALRLRCQPHWTLTAEEHALDDRSLTTCLMQHATLAGRIDERLARRLRRAA